MTRPPIARQSIAIRMFTLLLCLVLCCSLLPTRAAATDTYSEKLEELTELIRAQSLFSSEDDDPVLRALTRYFDENPGKFEEFLEYVFQSYDRYSHYMTLEQYSEAYPTSEEYVGIGVEMDDTRSGGNFIKNVFKASPAEEAGLLPGDEIVSVNGTDVTAYTLDGLTPIIRGAEGTEVTLGIRRDGTPAVRIYTLLRQAIQISNIEFEDLGDGVAYISIYRFGDLQTFMDFISLYRELPYKGFRSVIFDVRSNPGGNLDVLYNILNYIIPDAGKEILSIYSRNAGKETYRSTGAGWRPNGIAILIDEHSASAAEVFAGTLHELGYAKLFGATTYGKGVGQVHEPLEDGSVAIVTNFEIQPAGGTSYNGVGIRPDYAVQWAVVPYPMPSLNPLSYSRSIRPGEVSKDVLQLEKRLHLLGYLTDTPDETFDNRTLYAVQSFARSFNLRVLGYASQNMLYHLKLETENLQKTTIQVDTPLERALQMAKNWAKQPLSYELPPLELPVAG